MALAFDGQTVVLLIRNQAGSDEVMAEFKKLELGFECLRSHPFMPLRVTLVISHMIPPVAKTNEKKN